MCPYPHWYTLVHVQHDDVIVNINIDKNHRQKSRETKTKIPEYELPPTYYGHLTFSAKQAHLLMGNLFVGVYYCVSTYGSEFIMDADDDTLCT